MAAPLHPQTCLICGGRDCESCLRYDAPDAYERAVGVGDEGYAREWVCCRGCGFHYSRYGRDPEVLDRIYDRDYRDAGQPWRGATAAETFRKVNALPPAESETHERAQWVCDNFEPAGATPRLLDVGGGSGVFAEALRRRGWEVSVVDPSRQGRFLEAEGIAYKQAAYRARLYDRPFDLISLIYVLEHLRDPRAVVAAARQDLAPRGRLFIEVPDSLAFAHQDGAHEVFNACHLWMFDPESLRRLLGGLGFTITAMQRLVTVRGFYALRVLAAVEARHDA